VPDNVEVDRAVRLSAALGGRHLLAGRAAELRIDWES